MSKKYVAFKEHERQYYCCTADRVYHHDARELRRLIQRTSKITDHRLTSIYLARINFLRLRCSSRKHTCTGFCFKRSDTSKNIVAVKLQHVSMACLLRNNPTKKQIIAYKLLKFPMLHSLSWIMYSRAHQFDAFTKCISVLDNYTLNCQRNNLSIDSLISNAGVIQISSLLREQFDVVKVTVRNNTLDFADAPHQLTRLVCVDSYQEFQTRYYAGHQITNMRDNWLSLINFQKFNIAGDSVLKVAVDKIKDSKDSVVELLYVRGPDICYRERIVDFMDEIHQFLHQLNTYQIQYRHLVYNNSIIYIYIPQSDKKTILEIRFIYTNHIHILDALKKLDLSSQQIAFDGKKLVYTYAFEFFVASGICISFNICSNGDIFKQTYYEQLLHYSLMGVTKFYIPSKLQWCTFEQVCMEYAMNYINISSCKSCLGFQHKTWYHEYIYLIIMTFCGNMDGYTTTFDICNYEHNIHDIYDILENMIEKQIYEYPTNT